MVLRTDVRHDEAVEHGRGAPLVVTGGTHVAAVETRTAVVAEVHFLVACQFGVFKELGALGRATHAFGRQFPGHIVGNTVFGVIRNGVSLPFNKFFGMLLFVLIVTDDLALAVGIEGAFKAMAFGSDQGNIAIGLIAVLKKSQTSLIGLVEFCGFRTVPKHVVIASGQDLASRQIADEL